jgi:hypothetical protein
MSRLLILKRLYNQIAKPALGVRHVELSRAGIGGVCTAMNAYSSRIVTLGQLSCQYHSAGYDA